MEQTVEKKKRKSSLRFQIGLLYTLLALINIIFFSVMIFENQSDLLLRNFKFQSDNLASTLKQELDSVELTRNADENLEKLRKILNLYEVEAYLVFDSEGTIWHGYPKSKEETVSEALLSKTTEISGDKNLFKSNYKLDLDRENFKVILLLPIKGDSNLQTFLQTTLNLGAIQGRLKQLYFQVGLAVVWGIIFHVLFAFFLFRLIFKRLGILEKVTIDMSQGKLDSRANWKFSRNDEIDVLGESFNEMASSIEDKVKTISSLNEEIQKELEIGKEVQTLFLPPNKPFKAFKIGKVYRPMREVSGDIYHFHKHTIESKDESYFSFFLADVSGHGVSAALVTVVMSLTVDELVRKTMNPSKVLNALSAMMSDKLQSSFFATGVYLLIGPDGRVHYANAAHPTPIWFRPSTKEVHFLQSSGTPLGISEEAQYVSGVLDSKSGDKLILITDGITEAMNDAEEMYEMKRVVEFVQKNGDLPNQELAEALAKDLDDYISVYKDDVTIIIIEVP